MRIFSPKIGIISKFWPLHWTAILNFSNLTGDLTADKILKKLQFFSRKLVCTGFYSRWVEICCQIWKIENGWSNMTGKFFFKFHFFGEKISISGFLGLLIKNLLSGLENSKWNYFEMWWRIFSNNSNFGEKIDI